MESFDRIIYWYHCFSSTPTNKVTTISRPYVSLSLWANVRLPEVTKDNSSSVIVNIQAEEMMLDAPERKEGNVKAFKGYRQE